MNQVETPPQGQSIRARSLSSFKWSALGELLSRSLQPLLILIVGRLISPAEFGLLAIATIAIGVAQLLQDMGLGKTLIQTERDVDGYSNNIFWVNTSFSGALYLLIVVTAPWISEFFHAPNSVLILRVLCLRVLILALGAVHLARLQRELRFRATFLARLFGALTSALIVIPLALCGFGVWSLVWGMLAGTLIQTGLLWIGSKWRPQLEWSWPLFHSMFSFSKWVLLEGLLAAAINWGDSAILGHYLGTESLGKYRFAANMTGFLSGLLLAPFTPVALSMFSRLQSDIPGFRSAYSKLTRTVCAVIVPVGIGVALTASAIVPALFGPKWSGTEIVLEVLGLKLAIDALFGFNAVAYTAIGRPDINVKMLAVVCLFSVPAFIWSARYGLWTFCIVRLVMAILDNALNLQVSRKIIGIKWREIALALWPSLPAVFLMAFFVWSTRGLTGHSPVQILVCQVAIGAVTYFLAMVIMDRAFVKNFWKNVRIAR